ncbi:DNA polymerase III subunit delta [Corynebacterium aquatimens]|uniref:DNA-directed DNA polymerase n=1 Tax=Corynebacterium aquatimens TaxID=1190508 RepID=A0A931DXH8_9CORY|nr:DNA polymerase III subunit delta [Corynebacterium aquatimens]MBG6122117.1 DNA polymerase-3 subunit delta [Corynebacterium aquatimens]WJY65342.1 hypothetical protein CAQUA_03125 [Corynebacterium aquatimens]
MTAPVHLVLGEEEFLADRVTEQIIEESGPQAEVTTMRAGEVSEGELLQATSPSLFAEERVVVITNLDLAGKAIQEIVLAAAMDTPPGMTLVLVHSGGGRQKVYVKKYSKIATVHQVDPISQWERPQWVTSEFRRHGVRPTPDVVHAVLESVGSDLRELASAIDQLVSDIDGEITVPAVRAYYVGVAEVSGFDIADQAIAGNADNAIASTRRALQLGVAPVAIAVALSRKVGEIAKLYQTRGDHNAIAREVGMHPYAAKLTMQAARRWSGEAVSQAVVIVADLDSALKGHGGDEQFEIENAVRRIASLV